MESSTETLPPGSRVEVRTGFERSWAQGFEVAGVDGDGYLVKRLSDGALLPTAFSPDDIRPQRRDRNIWWV